MVYEHDYIWIYDILHRYTFPILNVYDIDKKEICITHKKMNFLIIFTGYILPATSYGSKLCFIINLYFYITFVDYFYAISFKMMVQHE